MAYFERPEEVLVRLRDLFETNKVFLGIKYIATQEERLIPEYPCVQIASEPLIREVHGTYTFQNTFVFVLWVYHANLEVGHATRTIEDMQLATNVVNFLHRPDVRYLRDNARGQGDFAEGEDRVIPSYVSLETPGMVRPQEGPAVITTRLLWLATGESRFEHG